jgi:hypothetical protein
MSFFIVPTIHTQRKPPHREDNPPRTLYLSLTSVTPHTHYSQPLTLSLLGQFIGLWLFLTVSQFIAFLESKSLDLTAKSKDLDSVVITALTYLLVSLVSFQFSRYGGQL